MLQRLRTRFNREEGFTLIELLVVILIVGILAAIAIPSFLNQTEKGDDASAKSAARSAQTAQETYYTAERAYGDEAAIETVEASLDFDRLAITPATPATDGYTIVATAEGGRTFTIQKAGDRTTYTCNSPGDGGCPSDSNWGPATGAEEEAG